MEYIEFQVKMFSTIIYFIKHFVNFKQREFFKTTNYIRLDINYAFSLIYKYFKTKQNTAII